LGDNYRHELLSDLELPLRKGLCILFLASQGPLILHFSRHTVFNGHLSGVSGNRVETFRRITELKEAIDQFDMAQPYSFLRPGARCGVRGMFSEPTAIAI